MLEVCRARPFPLRTALMFLPRSSRASSIASRRPTKSDRAPRRRRSGSSKRQQTRLTDPKDVEANSIAALASRFSPTRFGLTGAVPAGYPHCTACAPRRQAKNALSSRVLYVRLRRHHLWLLRAHQGRSDKRHRFSRAVVITAAANGWDGGKRTYSSGVRLSQRRAQAVVAAYRVVTTIRVGAPKYQASRRRYRVSILRGPISHAADQPGVSRGRSPREERQSQYI